MSRKCCLVPWSCGALDVLPPFSCHQGLYSSLSGGSLADAIYSEHGAIQRSNQSALTVAELFNWLLKEMNRISFTLYCKNYEKMLRVIVTDHQKSKWGLLEKYVYQKFLTKVFKLFLYEPRYLEDLCLGLLLLQSLWLVMANDPPDPIILLTPSCDAHKPQRTHLWRRHRGEEELRVSKSQFQ